MSDVAGNIRVNMTHPLSNARPTRKTYALASWLALLGVLLPPELSVTVAGLRLTPSRLAMYLPMVPAVFVLFSGQRCLTWSDFFIGATVGWMIFAGYEAGDSASISSSIAEASEFAAAFVTARVYLNTKPSLEVFVFALKVCTILVVALAFLDTLSGRFIVRDTIGALSHAVPPQPQYRSGMVRATSTLDHPILLGCFCVFAATIFLYFEKTGYLRVFFVGVCFVGCVLSISSAPLLGFLIMIAVASYDKLLSRYSAKWILFWTSIFSFVIIVFVASDHPVGWLIAHLTLEPQTGYYRIMIWELATAQIQMSPNTGSGFKLFNDEILDNTVDSVWLVYSLRFGLPMIVFLFVANVSAILGNRGKLKDSFFARLRTGFSIVLILFMFMGFTVHFWNYMWIFWGLSIGIRASIGLDAKTVPVNSSKIRTSTAIQQRLGSARKGG